GSGDVLGEGLAVIAFADEDIADEASGVDVVDAAAGLAAGGGQTEEDLADAAELCAIVPGLGCVDFGMMAFGTRGRGLQVGEFVGGIEIQDPLTGVADDGLQA